MVWIIIIVIVVIVIANFARDNSKQAEAVIKQGGMRNKYKYLVAFVLDSDPNSKIIQESNTSITIGLSSSGGTTYFIITQTFGSVSIQWKVQSPIFGKHQMEWSFDEFTDQERMIKKIENDLEVYQSNMINKYM